MRYVYCHPLFDERKCAHRFSYLLAKAFSSHNRSLERFDYRGTGEALGKFSEVTLTNLMNDVFQVIDQHPVTLIGLRIGGTIALRCAVAYPQIKKLILIDPILDGQEYVDYLMRKQHLKDMMTGLPHKHIRSSQYINIEGYKTSCQLIEELRHLNINSSHPKVNSLPPHYIIWISQAHIELNQDTQEVQISAPAFWERIPNAEYHNVINQIMEWCND